MAVTLTPKAATHVQSFLARRGRGVGLRVGVRTSGCSGMAYKLEFVDQPNPDDVQFESHGVKVVEPDGAAIFGREKALPVSSFAAEGACARAAGAVLIAAPVTTKSVAAVAAARAKTGFILLSPYL